MKGKISLYQSSALLIIILGTAVFSVWQVARSPSVLPDNSDPASFSAERAKQHVLAIAQQPHPNGSEAANKVEDYILQELSSIGIKANVQTENITSPGSNIVILQNQTQTENISVNGSTIECKNIVAMIEGKDNQDAVLLSAHYDSKENSPGASDDGIGVAALLETARALKSGPALKNTVILLFTNPEETGLQGARAFVSDDPLAKEVRVTWNVDAGGLKGPAFLITTSENNSWFIGELSKATPGIIGDGAIQTFETSSSDFDIFNNAGYIAAAYGMTQDNRNHSPQDNILNFQDESLQQIGNTTLQFVRYFGNIQLPDVTLQPVGNSNILSVPYNGGIQLPVVSKNQNAGSADATYFTIPQLFMFSYPVVAALPISVVIVLIFGFAIWFGFKNKLINSKGITFGMISSVFTIAISLALVTLLVNIVTKINPAYFPSTFSETYDEYYIWIACVAITLASMTASIVSVSRFKKVNLESCAVGVMIIPCLVVIIISVLKPMASAVLAAPMLMQALGLTLWLYLNKYHGKWFTLIAVAIPVMVAIYIFVTPIYIGFIGLKLNQVYFIVLFLNVFVSMLALPLNLILNRTTWMIPASMVLMAVIMSILAL